MEPVVPFHHSPPVAPQQRLKSLLASVSKKHHHLFHRAKQKEGAFLGIFDKVLTQLSDKLVPYAEVVNVVCSGSVLISTNVERSCGFCDTAISK